MGFTYPEYIEIVSLFITVTISFLHVRTTWTHFYCLNFRWVIFTRSWFEHFLQSSKMKYKNSDLFSLYKYLDGMLITATYQLLMVSWQYTVSDKTIRITLSSGIRHLKLNIYYSISLVFAIKPGLSSEGLATASSWVVNTHNRLNCYTMYHICN